MTACSILKLKFDIYTPDFFSLVCASTKNRFGNLVFGLFFRIPRINFENKFVVATASVRAKKWFQKIIIFNRSESSLLFGVDLCWIERVFVWSNVKFAYHVSNWIVRTFFWYPKWWSKKCEWFCLITTLINTKCINWFETDKIRTRKLTRKIKALFFVIHLLVMYHAYQSVQSAYSNAWSKCVRVFVLGQKMWGERKKIAELSKANTIYFNYNNNNNNRRVVSFLALAFFESILKRFL